MSPFMPAKVSLAAAVSVAVLCLVGVPVFAASPPPEAATARADAEIPAAEIPAATLLQPADLARILRSPGDPKPIILQVGSHVLYGEAHIAGAEYVGAAGQTEGLQALRDRVRSVERDRLIVLYCGCCPWSKCPNIRPAYRALLSLGFSRVKALYLADNFGTNWVDPGYPVEKGR